MEMVSIQGLKMSPSTKIPTAAVTVPTSARETFLPAEPGLERLCGTFQQVDKGRRAGEQDGQEEEDGKDLSERDAADDSRDGDEQKSLTGVRFHPVGEYSGMITSPERSAANVSKMATYLAPLTISTSDFR